MQFRVRPFVSTATLLLSTSLLLPRVGGAQTTATCKFTPFKPPSGYSWASPSGINDHGTIIGAVLSPPVNSTSFWRGLVRNPDGSMSTYLLTALALNNHGTLHSVDLPSVLDRRAEFVGRFVAAREPLPAISLSTDTSALTALANDYGFDCVFARQIMAVAQPGDTAIAISTSGNSANVVAGIGAARSKSLYTIGLTGANGGKMRDAVEVLFCVPSVNTPRIQETHIVIGHILCELIDRILTPDKYPRD